MRRFLGRIHVWATRNPVTQVRDPILGDLIINETCWECTVDSEVGPIVLAIGGRYEPAEGLMTTARQTVGQIGSFIDRVAEYLREESAQPAWAQFKDEINSLVINSINYWWPRRPNAGMIFFRGPDECRLWHADIDGPRLFGLTFDL